MKNKSQGLSLNVVVVAALALVVLIILIIIFADKIRPVSDFYGDCKKINGVVKNDNEECPPDKPINSPFAKEKGKKCCVSQDDLV